MIKQPKKLGLKGKLVLHMISGGVGGGRKSALPPSEFLEMLHPCGTHHVLSGHLTLPHDRIRAVESYTICSGSFPQYIYIMVKKII